MATTANRAVDGSLANQQRSVTRSSRLAAPIACGCCLVVGAAYVTAVDPSERGGFLPCPFRAVTGLWCPGCGLTRATHHLFRGDIVQALRYNLFVMVAVAAVITTWVLWLRRAATGTVPTRQRRVPAWAIAAAITLAVAFAVLRNMPGLDGLRG